MLVLPVRFPVWSVTSAFSSAACINLRRTHRFSQAFAGHHTLLTRLIRTHDAREVELQTLQVRKGTWCHTKFKARQRFLVLADYHSKCRRGSGDENRHSTPCAQSALGSHEL